VPVTTYVDLAEDRARAHREAAAEKRAAFDAFLDRVEELPPESASSSTGMAATAGTLPGGASSTGDRCRTVRTAFAETVRPHAVADDGEAEALLETIRSELSEPVAVALAPTTDASFTPALKRRVVSAAATRRAEAGALRAALDRETDQLGRACEVVDDVTAWLADADGTPLTELGFEALRDRHGTIADHRARCERLGEDRQAFLRETTTRDAEVGVDHRRLVPQVYEALPVDHPVLATVARLDAVCADCQRAVREHLVRRV